MANTITLDLNGAAPNRNNTTDYNEVGANPTPALFSAATIVSEGSVAAHSVTLVETGWTATESFGLTAAAQTAAAAAGVTITTNANGTFTLTHTGGGGDPSDSTWNTIIRGITYNNTADVPLLTDKSISVTATGIGGPGTFTSTATETVHVICFYPGTMIATPAGQVAVETLKRGDMVLTQDGRSMPVSWLGRQTVSTVFTDKLRVLPIRIKAGALGENVPTRDLLISPDHAILVDGALIQAGALINGTSIVRESNVPQNFTYYHVEVDDHSLILAENTPAETFVDNVDRLAFDNWAEHQALYPEGKSINELPYPRAKSHRQVPVAIRVKLADRALAIGAGVDSSAVA